MDRNKQIAERIDGLVSEKARLGHSTVTLREVSKRIRGCTSQDLRDYYSTHGDFPPQLKLSERDIGGNIRGYVISATYGADLVEVYRRGYPAKVSSDAGLPVETGQRTLAQRTKLGHTSGG